MWDELWVNIEIYHFSEGAGILVVCGMLSYPIESKGELM
jgi:hypothetical protein